MKEHEIDFILVSSAVRRCTSTDGSTPQEKRILFEENLQKDGLKLEKECHGCLTFVKIHAPEEVLQRYCEIMKFQMPLKKVQEEVKKTASLRHTGWSCRRMKHAINKVYNYFVQGDVAFDGGKIELLATYSREKSYLFDEEDPNFFTPAVRTLIVHFILNRETWNNREDGSADCFGLKKLLSDNVYIAAYPLHDGDYKDSRTERNFLFENWARLKRWYCIQPLDKIQQYLGTKHAFYFAWLGFYTRLLIPASIFGILVLLYGSATLPADHFSNDTCNANNITMCPTCDSTCDYFRLSDNCFYVKATYLFDNTFTFIFAFLMSIWASTFLEIWKRYSGILTHRWGLAGYSVEEEHPRPEYVSRVTQFNQFKVNPVTGKKEHVVPFWSVKLPTIIISYTVILFFIMLVIIAVVAVLVYRLWIKAIIAATSSPDDWLGEYSSFIVSGSAATLNLLSIMILNVIYSKVAEYLTGLELHRTQTEYENALTIKIYIFQFINYYSSIMYIAFFKGKFIGLPGHYNRVFGYRQEECSYGGCLMELSIQLAFIMIGKQIIGEILEMSMPALKNCLKTSDIKNTESIDISQLKEFNDLSTAPSSPWVDDFKLLDYESTGLFSEYLEMIIQFGFVTLFVPAFPLAPLFAFLNNIFEVRLDAQKILKYYRRPIPHRIPDIGVWYQILQITGNLAVLTNAIVIAFSSSFIAKLVYIINYGTDEGFLEHSLSVFNVSDFAFYERPRFSAETNVSVCMYEDFRQPPSSPEKYAPNTFYWQVFIARLIFIILFQNITYAVKGLVDYLIPDEPDNLKQLIKKERYLTTKMIIKWEMESANKTANPKQSDDEPLLQPSSTSADPFQQLTASLETGLTRLKSNESLVNQT